MRQTFFAVTVCLLLTAGTVWAAQQTLTLQPNETATVNGNGCDVMANPHAAHDPMMVMCGAAYTPVPSPTSTSTTTTIEGVPLCTDHDPTKWHPLVKRDANNAIICTYGHEHHADPNSVNDIFGPPGAWYGSPQEISYPWQTSSAAGMENMVKHEGYKWFVERDQPCRPFWPAPNDGCLIAWRVQLHSMGTASDAVVRFHSYSFEALVEYHGQRGIIRHGGWLDFGHLSLAASGGASFCPAIPANPDTFRCGADNHRGHSGADLPAPAIGADVNLAAWYAIHRLTQLSATVEEWGPVDYQNPTNQLFHDPAARRNNSFGSLGNMSVSVIDQWLAPYTKNGVVNFSGYTERSGASQGVGCTAPGVDCVPLRIEAVPAALYIWNSATQGDSLHYPDYDVSSPSTGKSLIRFPN